MLRATLHIDLPSAETDRRLGPIEWVRSMFGAEIDRRSGKEELTISALALIEGLGRALHSVGITDAISLLVDRRVVYLDTQEIADDLTLVVQAAESRGVLERPFREMHFVLSHHLEDLHVIIDIRVSSRVLLGEEELVADFSARPMALRPRPGEAGSDFAARVDAFSKDPAALAALRHRLDDLVSQVGDAIRRRVPGAVPRQDAGVVKVVKPDAAHVGRFRRLGFGAQAVSPTYRPVPTKHRNGPYDDPYVYYYHDPYWNLTNWLLISSMMHSHYPVAPDVVVVDSHGQTLATGADFASGAGVDGFGGSDLVQVGDSGVSVDSSIPDAGGGSSDPVGDAGGAWGGSDIGDGGWGGSDVGDSGGGGGDGGGSSCGSSCGGGGCGGGCGGGGD